MLVQNTSEKRCSKCSKEFGFDVIHPLSDFYWNDVYKAYYPACKKWHLKLGKARDKRIQLERQEYRNLLPDNVCEICGAHWRVNKRAIRILHTSKLCSSCTKKKSLKIRSIRNRDKINTAKRIAYAKKRATGWKRVRNPIERQRAYRKFYNRHGDRLRALSRERDKSGIYLSQRRKSVIDRRARLAGGEGSWTIPEWKELLNFYNNKCLRCGSTERLSFDHVIPVRLGGRNDIKNAQPLCVPCNCSKGKKTTDYRTGIVIPV